MNSASPSARQSLDSTHPSVPARSRRARTARAFLLSALLICSGCASTKIERNRVLSSLDGLPTPPVLLVYDFAVSADDVVVDTAGPALVTGDGEPSERLELAKDVQASLAKTIVSKLKKKGIKARRAKQGTRPPLDALLLKGQFRKVDEGDMMGRTVIGFGRGAKELKIAIQVYQMTGTGPRQLVDGTGTSTGGKKPGMLVPVVGGAALGRAATSAAVSGSVSIASELSGAFNTDVKKLADELGERAVQFYIDRGWL